MFSHDSSIVHTRWESFVFDYEHLWNLTTLRCCNSELSQVPGKNERKQQKKRGKKLSFPHFLHLRFVLEKIFRLLFFCSLRHENTTKTTRNNKKSWKENKNEHSHNIHENCLWNFLTLILLLHFKGDVTNDSQFFLFSTHKRSKSLLRVDWYRCMAYKRDSSGNIKKFYC